MNLEPEIKLIHDIIIHPCGYDVDIAGILWIRKYEYAVWAVEWEEIPNKSKITAIEFSNPMEAAKFFVHKRHEMELGLDYENKI